MFQSARLKLTSWYLLIIMAISLAFSGVIYQVIGGEIERVALVQRLRIERLEQEQLGLLPPEIRIPPPAGNLPDPAIFEEARHRLGVILLLINGGILVIAGGTGYFLAGRTLQPIREMVDEQHRFISDASHELRTPLTSLKSSMEVFLRDKHAKLSEGRQLIAGSIDQVNKLQTLSDSLLQLSQFHTPGLLLETEPLNLEQVIAQAVKRVEPMAKQKQIQIKNRECEVDVVGNKYQLIDLLVILLDNAIKYTPSGGNITIGVAGSDGMISLSVIDTGIGIAKADIPHIFDRFYRADSARTKSARDGYGLGLSIAKKIVEAHHGTISVESVIGQGSTFTVRLPKSSPRNSAKV
jgi:two-component system sensor histidine kinase CiaH